MEWNDKIENQKKTNRKFYKCKNAYKYKKENKGRKLDKKKKKKENE